MSLETPLHKVQGMGSSHSGVSHFWRQRVTAAALIPLSVWFGVSVLGLIGAHEAATLAFLSQPLNAILMAFFVVILLFHMALGLQVGALAELRVDTLAGDPQCRGHLC